MTILTEDSPLLDPDNKEKRLLRKLDRRILPLTCLLYLFAYLDRSNLGNARLQGLPDDTLGGDPTGVMFDYVNSAFYVTYIIFQVPWTVLSKYYSPRLWIGYSAILWGLCSTSMSTANSFSELIVARLMLGVFEAAFGPSVVLYFSFYYTKKEYGTRVAYWFGFAAVAGAFGGLLAYGIHHTEGFIAHWRLLFILEGFPTILLGIICIFLLPDRPESTEFLTPAERKLAVARINRGTSSDFGAVVNYKHVVAAFVYMAGVIYFGLNCALGSLSAFLPTIISTMGFGSVALAQLMVVPPYAAAGTFLVIISYTSDKVRIRGPFIVASCAFGGLGYLILLGVTHNQYVRYFATFCVAVGTYTSIGLVLAWCKRDFYDARLAAKLTQMHHEVTHNLGSETKRATGMPLFGAIGQCGSILGSHLYPLTEGPAYTRGFGISAALLILGAVCALILSLSYRAENRLRDAQYGVPNPDETVDTSEFADKAPSFRYVP
ncbi:hypothetical protein SCLCIDRAFT_18679 [Scleroderma citrinum Foug A]|uniref:Major facilitator superfamily (MFS) profile domain-containing protein n=1 Tax=Scleroderma citrinum Foug A TaxID=1036808 RepID=A0A0C3AA09_9AGAM|nr:hypothetical protein SCLCIDRAFT_18679 [Scleroderma citrinum Foug A]